MATMNTKSQTGWETLAPVPTDDTLIIPNGLNRNNFFVIDRNYGLIQYNFDENSWENLPDIDGLPDKLCEYINSCQ